MGTKSILAISLIAVLGLIGIVSTSYAQVEAPQDKICDNETITSGIFKSITVTPNSICSIVHVEVIGDVRAENAIHLGVGFSTIGGNIIVNSIESFEVGFSTINKSVKIDGATNYISIFHSNVGKDLVIKNSSTLTALDVERNQISKNFEIKDNNFSQDFDSDETRIIHNEISGKVKIKKNTNFVDFFFVDNNVGKNIHVSDNDSEDNNSRLIISSNEALSGKIEIKNNVVDSITSSGNTVAKNLKITKNISNTVVSNWNTVDKTLEISNHSDLDSFSIENNAAKKIKIKNNHTDVRFHCGDNSSEPDMKKNTFAGLDFNDCTLAVNP